jgi:CofD-related protein of GAK system
MPRRKGRSPSRVQIHRGISLPDPVRVARSRRAPELGPRVLFVSGGTALRPLCRVLKTHTHNSIHLVTSFDSGGSSASLRRTFGMPSVGDLRSRLIALADETARGNPEIYELFSHRLDADGDSDALGRRLDAMIAGHDDLVARVPEPLRGFARRYLGHFAERMPSHFDLRGASVGNLILTGGYLSERDLDGVLYLFSHLLAVRGTVYPILNDDFHLAVHLEDGSRVVGQHAITGKEAAPLTSPIERLEIIESLERPEPAAPLASEKVLELIQSADLICYPMGSFFSSVVCNLLPEGVGQAIASARCPKVYIPSTGHDPEQHGLDVARATHVLLDALRRDAGRDAPTEHLLNFVLLDPRPEYYAQPCNRDSMKQLGVEVIDLDLVSETEPPQIDPERLTEILLSLS